MKKTVLLFLILNCFSLFGQKYSINSKLLKSGIIKLDSVEVTISVYEDKIETESHFAKSNSKLTVAYLKNGETYNNIITRENNLEFENCYRENEFDFENGATFNGEERFYASQTIVGKFEEIRNSYSKTLNHEFMKNYVIELYDKIKNYR